MSEGYKTNKSLKCSVCGKDFYCSVSQQTLRNRVTCSKKCKGKIMEITYLGRSKDRKGLIHKLEQLSNTYARIRDCGGRDGYANCISCGVLFPFDKLDGGHFIPKTSSAIRFDERNINAQCVKCNRYLSGNSRHYLKGMINKYGQEVVDELEGMEFVSKKWTIEELYRRIEYYKEQVKLLTY